MKKISVLFLFVTYAIIGFGQVNIKDVICDCYFLDVSSKEKQCIETYKNHIFSIRMYKDTLAHGTSTWFWKDGSIKYIIQYSNGLINGDVKYFRDKKLIDSSFYKNDTLNGIYESYYYINEKRMLEKHFEFNNKGKRDGNFYYTLNGNSITGNFEMDKPYGIFKYNYKGDKYAIEEFKNGDIISSRKFFEKDQLTEECLVAENKKYYYKVIKYSNGKFQEEKLQDRITTFYYFFGIPRFELKHVYYGW